MGKEEIRVGNVLSVSNATNLVSQQTKSLHHPIKKRERFMMMNDEDIKLFDEEIYLMCLWKEKIKKKKRKKWNDGFGFVLLNDKITSLIWGLFFLAFFLGGFALYSCFLTQFQCNPQCYHCPFLLFLSSFYLYTSILGYSFKLT